MNEWSSIVISRESHLRDTRELYTRVRYAITNHWRACSSYPDEIIESRNTCQAFHRASYRIQTNCTRDIRCRDFSLFFNLFQSVNIFSAIYFFFQNGNWNICENIRDEIWYLSDISYIFFIPLDIFPFAHNTQFFIVMKLICE